LVELCDHLILQAKVTLYASKKNEETIILNSTPSHGRVELQKKTERENGKKKAKDYKRSPINPLGSGFLAQW
jgi:hypothetical protein